MAKIITRFTLGDTIEFIDGDGTYHKVIINMIKTELVQGFGLWILYGYGNLYEPDYVSEDQILKYQSHKKATHGIIT